MISPLKQAIHFSGAPPGEEQPDEAGLQLLPRDEVHAKALLQRQPDQIGEVTMMIYMTTIMVLVMTRKMVMIMMMMMVMNRFMLYFNDNQIRSVR